MHVNLVRGLSDWVREERKIHFEEKENDKVKRYSSKKCRESVCWVVQPERKAERSRMFAVVLSQDMSICLLQDKYCYNAGQESAYPPTASFSFLKHFHNNYSFYALGLNHVLLPKALDIFLKKKKKKKKLILTVP